MRTPQALRNRPWLEPAARAAHAAALPSLTRVGAASAHVESFYQSTLYLP